jgi:hypothetical protein
MAYPIYIDKNPSYFYCKPDIKLRSHKIWSYRMWVYNEETNMYHAFNIDPRHENYGKPMGWPKTLNHMHVMFVGDGSGGGCVKQVTPTLINY